MRAVYYVVNQLRFVGKRPNSRRPLNPYRTITIGLLSVFTVRLHAQQMPSGSAETQILQQLVAEVRQLRLTLERANSTSLRAQITLQRIQLEQNQVRSISAQLQVIRNDITGSGAEQSNLASNLAEVEGRIEQEQNPDTRKILQSEQRRTKSLIEQKARVIQEQQSSEGELASLLQTEQGKLSALQATLDALDKSIGLPAQ